MKVKMMNKMKMFIEKNRKELIDFLKKEYPQWELDLTDKVIEYSIWNNEELLKWADLGEEPYE